MRERGEGEGGGSKGLEFTRKGGRARGGSKGLEFTRKRGNGTATETG